MARGRVLVGVSGWSYDSWQGPYYLDGMLKARRLEHVGSSSCRLA